ncbi:MAG: putative toxin-antitoxin system toxin component, PIN family [Phormidesmis sp.]
MKVVIDVNVWISGLLWGGVPGENLRLAYEERITSYVSPELMRELEVTLQRPKFQPQLKKRDHTAESLLAIAASLSQFVSITVSEFDDLRDPADAKIIATAIAAQAQALITGDRDLLVLQTVQNVPMLTPAQFLSAL